MSSCRKTEPARLTALMRGDLDWIVMKALEKDRSRRYETASGMAAPQVPEAASADCVADLLQRQFRFVGRGDQLFPFGFVGLRHDGDCKP